MRGKGGRGRRIACEFAGALDVARSCDGGAMCIVMTAVVTVQHNGAVYVARLGSSAPGVPGLGTYEGGSAPYWSGVSPATPIAPLEPPRGGRANTVNKWSGPPSEPFAGRLAPTTPWHWTILGSSGALHTDHERLSLQRRLPRSHEPFRTLGHICSWWRMMRRYSRRWSRQ